MYRWYDSGCGVRVGGVMSGVFFFIVDVGVVCDSDVFVWLVGFREKIVLGVIDRYNVCCCCWCFCW